MYLHGGDIYSDKRITRDFSINLNPLGMPESVKKSIINSIDSFQVYPDYSCRELKDCIVKREFEFGSTIHTSQLVCGNGAAELIYDAVRGINPSKALLLAPSFLEYEKALLSVNCEIDYHMLKEEDGYRFTSESFTDYINKIKSNKYDIVFLCNPDNPVGNILKQELMYEIVRICSDYGTFVILDECFIDFTNEKSMCNAVKDYGNLLVLKAFTKTYSMAGLRLGYGITSNQGLIDRIESKRQCWNVSMVAQVAGIAACKETDYVYKTREYIEKERNYLEKELVKLGFKIYGDCCNYLFFHCNIDLYKLLYEQGILIRDCSNYKGLEKGYYRIGIKSHDENMVLIGTIGEML